MFRRDGHVATAYVTFPEGAKSSLELELKPFNLSHDRAKPKVALTLISTERKGGTPRRFVHVKAVSAGNDVMEQPPDGRKIRQRRP